MTRKKQVNNQNGAVLNRDFPKRGRSLIMVPEELRRVYPNAKPEHIEMALKRFRTYECGEGEIRVLRIGKNKAYQLVSNGEIESVKIGCKAIVPKLSVAKFLMTSEDYAMLLSGQSR